MKETGGGAFPGVEGVPGHGPMAPVELPNGARDWVVYREGMTLRDYFAAKAMQSMVCADMDNGRIRDAATAERTAKLAYVVADAMLTERAKP